MKILKKNYVNMLSLFKLRYLDRMVKDLVMMTDYGQIKQVISTLEHEFTLSSNPNCRKGGLVGLAATAIALGRVSRERERENIYIMLLYPSHTDVNWYESARTGSTSFDLF